MTDATKQVPPFRAKARRQGRPLCQRCQPAKEGLRLPSVCLAIPALTLPLRHHKL
jgi:hypothetical protein